MTDSPANKRTIKEYFEMQERIIVRIPTASGIEKWMETLLWCLNTRLLSRNDVVQERSCTGDVRDTQSRGSVRYSEADDDDFRKRKKLMKRRSKESQRKRVSLATSSRKMTTRRCWWWSSSTLSWCLSPCFPHCVCPYHVLSEENKKWQHKTHQSNLWTLSWNKKLISYFFFFFRF